MDKQIYLSTTIQGAVVSFLSLLVLAFKLEVSDTEITQFVAGLFGLIGLVMTIYGRIKANRNLKIGSRYL